MNEYLIKYKDNYFLAKYNNINSSFITFAEEYSSYDVTIIAKVKDIENTFLKRVS